MSLEETEVLNQLKNIEINGFEIKQVVKHPKSRKILLGAEQIIAPKYKLNSDLAEVNLYGYPNFKNIKLASLLMTFNFWTFLLDDHLDNNPKGMCLLMTSKGERKKL